MMTSSCLKSITELYLLAKESCIIFILFLCYIQQLLVLVAVLHSSESFCRSAARARILLNAMPIN